MNENNPYKTPKYIIRLRRAMAGVDMVSPCFDQWVSNLWTLYRPRNAIEVELFVNTLCGSVRSYAQEQMRQNV